MTLENELHSMSTFFFTPFCNFYLKYYLVTKYFHTIIFHRAALFVCIFTASHVYGTIWYILLSVGQILNICSVIVMDVEEPYAIIKTETFKCPMSYVDYTI